VGVTLGVGVNGTPGPGKRLSPLPAWHWKYVANDNSPNRTISVIRVNRRTRAG
jgi:hypothetical protein